MIEVQLLTSEVLNKYRTPASLRSRFLVCFSVVFRQFHKVSNPRSGAPSSLSNNKKKERLIAGRKGQLNEKNDGEEWQEKQTAKSFVFSPSPPPHPTVSSFDRGKDQLSPCLQFARLCPFLYETQTKNTPKKAYYAG